MGVVGNTDMSGFRTDLRRRLGEAREREGRIMKKMSKMKPGQARRRLRKGMRGMPLGRPDQPDSIISMEDLDDPMVSVIPPIVPIPAPGTTFTTDSDEDRR